MTVFQYKFYLTTFTSIFFYQVVWYISIYLLRRYYLFLFMFIMASLNIIYKNGYVESFFYRYVRCGCNSINDNIYRQQLKDHQTRLLFVVFDILVTNNVRSRRGVVMRAAARRSRVEPSHPWEFCGLKCAHRHTYY